MAGSHNSVIPDAVENAYIVLLGQITLVLTFVLASLAALFATRALNWNEIYDHIFVLVVAVMLAVNILSGWMSCRDALAYFNQYSNRLLAFDIVFLMLFFSMNNVVSIASSVLFSGSNFLSFSFNEEMKVFIHEYFPAYIYLLSFFICALYYAWNKLLVHAFLADPSELASTSRIDLTAYNRFLVFASIVQVGLVVAAIAAPQNSLIRFGCLVVWVLIWLWLNMSWILSEPLKAAMTLRNDQRPESS